MQKVELGSDKIVCLAEISKPGGVGAAWFFLDVYNKARKEKDGLKKELLRSNQSLKIWNILSLFIVLKKRARERVSSGKRHLDDCVTRRECT